MKLNKENYFGPESNLEYMSVSQYKSFCKCEARTLAEIRGEWKPKKTTALLVGSYVDAYFEGSLGQFRADNPEIFTASGILKNPYKQAETIIDRIELDPLMMELLSGEKQVIRTGEIDGVPFKIKMDSYFKGKRIVDLKVMRDFKPIYVPEQGRLNFIEAWGYDIQGAVYQAIEGHKLPFIIAAATKETEPDIGAWEIGQAQLDTCMDIVRRSIQAFALLKIGIGTPARCETCDYCKHTKQLETIKEMEDLDYEFGSY